MLVNQRLHQPTQYLSQLQWVWFPNAKNRYSICLMRNENGKFYFGKKNIACILLCEFPEWFFIARCIVAFSVPYAPEPLLVFCSSKSHFK